MVDTNKMADVTMAFANQLLIRCVDEDIERDDTCWYDDAMSIVDIARHLRNDRYDDAIEAMEDLDTDPREDLTRAWLDAGFTLEEVGAHR